MRKKILMLLGLALVFMPAVAGADKGGYHGAPSSADHVESEFYKEAKFLIMHKDELGLGEEQFKKAKDTKAATKKELITLNAQRDVAVVDIHTAFNEDTIDVEAANALLDKIADIEKQKMRLLVSQYAELKNLLTGEQKATRKEMFREHAKITAHGPMDMKGSGEYEH